MLTCSWTLELWQGQDGKRGGQEGKGASLHNRKPAGQARKHNVTKGLKVSRHAYGMLNYFTCHLLITGLYASDPA